MPAPTGPASTVNVSFVSSITIYCLQLPPSTCCFLLCFLLIFVGVVLLNCGHGQAKEKRGEVATPDGNYRYKLWRIWNPSKPRLLVIGCNPSNGDANYDDPTLREAKHFEHIFTVLHVCVF